MSIKGFGDTLNWMGSVEAAMLDHMLLYTLYEIPKDTTQAPVGYPLRSPVTLVRGSRDVDAAAGIVSNWDNSYSTKRPSQDTNKPRILRFPAHANVDKIHVITVGVEGPRIAIPSAPCEIIPGLYAWVSP